MANVCQVLEYDWCRAPMALCSWLFPEELPKVLLFKGNFWSVSGSCECVLWKVFSNWRTLESLREEGRGFGKDSDSFVSFWGWIAKELLSSWSTIWNVNIETKESYTYLFTDRWYNKVGYIIFIKYVCSILLILMVITFIAKWWEVYYKFQQYLSHFSDVKLERSLLFNTNLESWSY